MDPLPPFGIGAGFREIAIRTMQHVSSMPISVYKRVHVAVDVGKDEVWYYCPKMAIFSHKLEAVVHRNPEPGGDMSQPDAIPNLISGFLSKEGIGNSADDLVYVG